MSLARLFDRYPFNSPFVAAFVSRYGLPVWFGVSSLAGIAKVLTEREYLLFDARLYLEATRTWLRGGNAWDVGIAGNYFAAPPPTLLPLVPFALLPGDLGLVLLMVAVIGGAVATIRVLRLPWWWLLFPPLVQSVVAGNVQALLVPLILVGGGALAVFLKIYSAVPMAIAGHWRGLVVAGVALVASLPLLPWADFVRALPLVQERLVSQSTDPMPIWLLAVLSPAIVLAMLLAGRTNSAWLAVPALWPSHQFYYGTLAMPVRSKVAVALVALPAPGAPLAALFLLAAMAWRRGERPRAALRGLTLKAAA